ncbi:20567_t:CDS:2, partial [Gigaspora rosea]
KLEFYAKRPYSDQLTKATDYLELKPVILLTIETHKVFPDEVSYLSYHCNREEKTDQLFLPNLSAPKKAPIEIKEAYKILERYRWSSVDNYMYERTMIAILDKNDAIRTAKNEGCVLALLEMGFSHDEIVRITGLSSSEITQLINFQSLDNMC